MDFLCVAASVAATRAVFGISAKFARTILASEQNFSERLNSLLTHGKKGKLAAFCGVEASTVSRWLSGQTIPAGETVFKIAQFLGKDAKWLMSGESAESSSSPNDPSVGDSAHLAYAGAPEERSKIVVTDPHLLAVLERIATALEKLVERG